MSAEPKLRFSGFNEDWKNRKLPAYADLARGRFSPRPRNDPRFYGGNIPFIQTGDIVRSNGTLKNYTQTLNEDGLKVSKLFPVDTIIMTIAANIGDVAKATFPVAFPDSLVGLKPNEDTDPDFLCFGLSRLQRKLDYIAPEGAQKNINIEFLEHVKFSAPTLPEQEKIAAFLCAVDSKVEAEEAQVAGWREYKRGMMQALLSQTLRFKADDGSEFPDWQQKRLGEIAQFKKGKGISKADITDSGEQKCIRYGELYTTYSEVIDTVVSSTDTPPIKPVLSQGNDILMPTSDVTPTGLATASALSESGVILGGDVLIIRSEKILNKWFAFWVAANTQKIMRLVSGATVYHIYGSDMATIRLLLPSLPEQKKIANYLSALDTKIDTLNDRLDATREFKRGLLQKMFV